LHHYLKTLPDIERVCLDSSRQLSPFIFEFPAKKVSILRQIDSFWIILRGTVSAASSVGL